MKKFSNLKISQIKNKLTLKEFIEIIKIIKQENTHALISNLSKDLIKKYLKTAIKSKNIFLYILKKKKLHNWICFTYQKRRLFDKRFSST